MPKTNNNFKRTKSFEAPKQTLNTINEKDKIKKRKNKEKISLLTVSIPERLLKKFEEEAEKNLWKKSTLMKLILEKRYGKENNTQCSTEDNDKTSNILQDWLW